MTTKIFRGRFFHVASISRRKRNRLAQRILGLEQLETRALLAAGTIFEIFTDESLSTVGLIGSYVDENLREVDEPDWRDTQTISGTRVDERIDFQNEWGIQSEVGLTGGTDANWNNFSVQWDGILQISQDGVRLATRSDDSSRMWIDVDHDGVFAQSELVDNNWGTPQATTLGPSSLPLDAGVYKIRIQYQEDSGGAFMSLSESSFVVHVGYIIPRNRTPQEDGVATLQAFMPKMQEWYREQMDRNGFGPKTFVYETMPDGVTPKIHVVNVDVDDSFLRRGDSHQTYFDTIDVSRAAGLPIDDGAWLLVPESHLQNPDGSIAGGVALGGSVAMFGSDYLFRLSESALLENEAYAGQIVPDIGPYPLVQSVSFPSFEGSTISSIASSAQGAVMHELGHFFGLGHDSRNDRNFHGNLQGNGLRGYRGSAHPDLYPDDDMRLAFASALTLNADPYFNSESILSDLERPTSFVSTSGLVNPINGLLEVNFTASDNIGLSHALLRENGGTVAELVLSGSTASGTFVTPYYEPGTADSYQVSVYDTQGNRHDENVTINVRTGFNRAPQPSVRIYQSRTKVNVPVRLDATSTVDPDGSSGSVLIEWDLDGDGVFDTAPTTNKVFETSYSVAGTHFVQARATDSAGDSAVSAPIAIRIEEPIAALIYVSSTTSGVVDGIAFDNEDILGYDTRTDTWSMFFDASDVGLNANSEDVDGVSFAPDGRLVLSTIGAFSVPKTGGGTLNGLDEDLIVFNGSFGPNTSGTFQLYFDGSDVAMKMDGEDINAVSIDAASGDIFLSTTANLMVPGFAAGQSDVSVFHGIAGPVTSGLFAAFFDGDAAGISGENIDGLTVVGYSAPHVALPPQVSAALASGRSIGSASSLVGIPTASNVDTQFSTDDDESGGWMLGFELEFDSIL